MIYILQIIIILETLLFCKFAFFIFNKKIQLEGLAAIFSQIFSILIWFNTLQTILTNDISPLKIKIGIGLHLFAILLYLTHLQNPSRATFEVDEDAVKAISKYGMYNYIRHPLFTIYLICYFTTFILFGDSLGIFLSFSMAPIYIQLGKYRDRHMLDTAYSEDYKNYMNQTGVLLPNPFSFFK